MLALLLSGCICGVYAQEVSTYAVHANIIYRCTKYIDWPGNKKTGNFIIGVIGETPLYKELSNITANKLVGNRKITVRVFSASERSYDCHILFVAEAERKELKKIAARTAGTPTLIMSESAGLARKGSCINFIIVEEHLRLEINKNNIEQRGLSIASELLHLGNIIN